MPLEMHPVTEVFPRMSAIEYSALKADIEKNGLIEPIWTYQGQIIDGRHRYMACCELGINTQFREWDGRGSLVEFVVSMNLHRRHLNGSQRAMLAARIKPLFEAEAERRMKAELKRGTTVPAKANLPERDAGQSRDKAAAITNVSGRSVETASRVLHNGVPELAAKVDSAKIAVSTAADISVLPAEKQRIIAASDKKTILIEAKKIRREKSIAAAQKRDDRKMAEMKARAAAINESTNPLWQVITGDCIKVLKSLKPNSVRLAFADPPYNLGVNYGPHFIDNMPQTEYLDWIYECIELIERILTSDGSFWMLNSWENYPEIILEGHRIMRAYQTVVWYESFGVNQTRAFNRTSRPLIWFVKDAARLVFNDHAPEIRRPSDRQTKYDDPRAVPDGKVWDDVWGINPPIPRLTGTCDERVPGFPTQLPVALLRPIIACASNPGDLVVDPFCGSGTTGVAAIKLGRRFIGIELSNEFADKARIRLAAVSTTTQSYNVHSNQGMS